MINKCVALILCVVLPVNVIVTGIAVAVTISLMCPVCGEYAHICRKEPVVPIERIRAIEIEKSKYRIFDMTRYPVPIDNEK